MWNRKKWNKLDFYLEDNHIVQLFLNMIAP